MLSTIEKRNILKIYRMEYTGGKIKKFKGYITVNDGEFELSTETPFTSTSERCLELMKAALIKAYAKID